MRSLHYRLPTATALFGRLPAAALFWSGLALNMLGADDGRPAATKTPPAAKAPSAASNADAGDAKPDSGQPHGADRYRLPPGDNVKSLIEFIQRIDDFEPSTEAEKSEYRSKAMPAIEAAAEKIIKLEKDPESNIAKQARVILLNILDIRIDAVEKLDPKQQRNLVDAVLKMLNAGALTENHRDRAMTLATNLEYGGNPSLAAEAYLGIAKALAGGDNETFHQLAKKCEGAYRRLTSIGKPLEITGRTVDGKPFDWAKYRGKVVLIDFWATWCGPCRAELPNIRKNYDKYHAQGFDVVGVSTDEDREKLMTFLDEEKPPWATLQDAGGDDPTRTSLADHYGIFGIPATFLVDRRGNVISTQARGENLGPQIEKALAADKSTTGK